MLTNTNADARTLKALEIAQTADTWRQLRTREGELVYAIPSQTTRGLYYLTSTSSCTCLDAHHNGLRAARVGMDGLHSPCKHIRALALRKVLDEGAEHDLVLKRLPSGEYAWLKPEPEPAVQPDNDAFWRRFQD